MVALVMPPRKRDKAMNAGINASMVITAFELPGYRIVRNHGVVRGIMGIGVKSLVLT
jgi:hypothetical protein